MNIQIFAKSKCFDSKKAERWFKERRIPFQRIDLQSKGMSKGELLSVIQATGGVDALIEPGTEEATLIKYLAHDEDKFDKLLDSPRLIKTPIVRNGKQATIGFAPDVWSNWK